MRFSRRLKIAVLSAVFATAFASTASGAGYSTFYSDNYPSACSWKGVAKTYYDNGSSSSEVHVRGRWYWDPNSNGGWYEEWGPLEDHQYGSGAKEARVAHNQPSYGQHRVEGRHWGSPWGATSMLSQATAGSYYC